MKALLVIILSAVGLTSAQDYDSYCTETSGIYAVPSPTDCESFILCTGSVGSLQQCLDGKWFDNTYLVCLPKSIAKCDRIPVVSVPIWVLQLCSSLDVGQTIPAETCSNYYICYGATAFELSCPNGQHYSRAYSACMNPVDAGCKALNTMCLGEVPGFTFPSQTCENYYTCDANNIPQLTACGGGLYYNGNNGTCTQPALSGCVNPGTPILPTTSTSTKSTSSSTSSSSSTTKSSSSSSSSTTKSTSSSTSTTKSTSKNTTPPIPTTTPLPTTPGSPICNAFNTGSFYMHPKCNWFYMCFNSAALEFTCEPGQYYDPPRAYCVEDVDGVCPLTN